MHSTIMDPTGGTFAGFIVEPIDVVTMADIMGADITDLIIAPTITGLIVGMCVECTVEPTDVVITDASLERPSGREPRIGEPPALACSRGLPRPIRQAASQIRLAASRA